MLLAIAYEVFIPFMFPLVSGLDLHCNLRDKVQSPQLSHARKILLLLTGHTLESKILKKTAIPSIFSWTKEESQVVKSRRERVRKWKRCQEEREPVMMSGVDIVIGADSRGCKCCCCYGHC